MEFARGGPRLRARTQFAAGKPGAHALAASTAAPRAGLTYASSLTRPSLGPMSAKNLRSPRERNDERRRRRNDADAKPMTTQALAKLQSTRASLTDYAVELDKSADAKTGYKAKYADGKDYVLATYEKTKTQVNEYAVEPTTTYATETYAYVGDKFVSTKDYAADTYDSAKTYTYDTTLSLVENAKAMTEKMMLAMGSRKEAPETVAAEAEVMEA